MTEQVPLGYQLQVKTWENDADYYKTKILSGLTKEDVIFYLDLAKQFYCKNGWEPEIGIGNDEITDEELINVIQSRLEIHKNISKDVRSIFDIDVDIDIDNPAELALVYHEVLCENLLGYPETELYNDEFQNFCRAFDSFKVLYFDKPGIEVTNEFK
jgi:hypothetical protein